MARRLPQLRKRDYVMLAIGGAVVLSAGALVRYIEHTRTPLPYRPAGITARWIPSTVTHWQSTIDAMSKKYNVDANLVAILMTMESGGDATAKSPDDAEGLMQITPPTAQDIASKFLQKPVEHYNLQDPTTNIEFGAAYLAYLRDLFGTTQQGPDWNSTVELIAAGYNGGPGAAGNLEAGKGLHDTQTVVYSRDAFNMWRERRAGTSPTFDRWKERGGSTLLTAAQTSQH